MSGATTIARAWLAGFEPAPDITVSEWAERHRRLPEASAARGGRWRNETAPFLTGLMDATIERGVRQIAIQKAAQCGVSESLTNVLLFHMHARPCPMLFLLPTTSAATSFAKERLGDALRSIPELRNVVTDKRVPSSAGLPESSLLLKVFPAGFCALGGGNSPNSYARWSVRIAIADDCDRIPRHIGAEGNASELLINRTTSFHDGLTLFTSTPVLAGGRIETLFQQGDQRRYFVPCFACGRWDFVTWNDPTHWRVAFDDRQPATARLQCPCGAVVREPERMDLVRAGEWRPTATPLAPGFVSFHVPAMISPFVTLTGLATKFLAAVVGNGGARALREFTTQSLGEGWRDPATALDPADLASRLEDF